MPRRSRPGWPPLALGSDGGGSIRIPAACCGIVGIKPGPGLVPLADGVSQHWHGLTAFGPLARCAADAAVALRVLAGQPGLDPSDAAEPARRPLRIAVSARHPAPGARVALAMVRRGQRAARRVRPASDDPFARRAADWLGRYDALLTPTLARPAVPLGTWAAPGWVRAMLGVGNWLYTTPWNLAGLPAASVPFGSDQGLPLGLQIVAPAGAEPTVLALAAEIERLRP